MAKKKHVLFVGKKLHGEIDMSCPVKINQTLTALWSDFGYPCILDAVDGLMQDHEYRHVEKGVVLKVRRVK